MAWRVTKTTATATANEDEAPVYDDRFTSWADARQRLCRLVLPLIDDVCEVCARRSFDAITAMLVLKPNEEIAFDIDGDVYEMRQAV